jgi:hypothetical protein
MSLKDHSDIWVNAATFIHSSNTHLQGPGRSHGTRSVVLQGTTTGKACSPQGAPPSSQFVWAEIAWRSIHSGGIATTRQDLSYSRKRDPLARRGAYRRESLDASECPECWRFLESALCWVFSMCPFYMSFSSRVFSSSVI